MSKIKRQMVEEARAAPMEPAWVGVDLAGGVDRTVTMLVQPFGLRVGDLITIDGVAEDIAKFCGVVTKMDGDAVTVKGCIKGKRRWER